MKRSLWLAWGIFLTALIIVIPGQSGSNAQSKYKSIKVLTAMSDADIAKEMQAWTKALGERCTYCHEGNDYASDANPKKETARKMATMVTAINKTYLDGKASCMLCHRGVAVPDADSAPATENK